MDNNTSPFAAPDAGNLQSGKQEFFPQLEYSTMKTPANFVVDVTPTKVADARANHKLGFHFYDKDAGAKVAVDKFSFVVLECYSGISGSCETSAGSNTWVSYYSNYVRNSKTEPFALWEKGIKRPIASGYYDGKKNDYDFAKLLRMPRIPDNEAVNTRPDGCVKIPAGAGFHQHFIVWWIEGQRIMDLKLTTMVSREIKNAIARAEATAGRKVKPDRVNLFALADGGAFWGFTVTKFRRATKEGLDYAGAGEMYLVPEFVSGVVKTEGVGANPELHAECVGYQSQIRANYAAEKERRARYGVENASAEADPNPVQSAPPANGDQNFPSEYREPTNHDQGRTIGNGTTGGGIDFSKHKNTDTPPPHNDDDLPF